MKALGGLKVFVTVCAVIVLNYIVTCSIAANAAQSNTGNSVIKHTSNQSAVAEATIRLPYDNLLKMRESFRAGNAGVVNAVNLLQKEADSLLDVEPFTVITKPNLPASGNKNDYFSFAPYWWPNPDTEDGYPWVKMDGKKNPHAYAKTSNKTALNDLMDSTQSLSLAYFFTGKKAYADKTAELLKVWFLNEETKMNPHLKYAQAIPGKVDGRGIGIIDARGFYRVLDSILLIKPSQTLTEGELAGLDAWFSEYLEWLVESPLGIDERKTKNNHGTFYDYQVAAIALFVNNEKIAKDAIKRAQKRLKAQITKDGKQPLELERTRPFHYSVFNLQAFVGLAKLASEVGVDLWQYPSAKDDRIEQAFDYLIAHSRTASTMNGTQEATLRKYDFIPVLPDYAHKYGVSIESLRDHYDPEHGYWVDCGLLFLSPDFFKAELATTTNYKPCRY
ncbi:alginate lyase family protein [Saccharophagus degradans]|uniref:Alginate lyase family protein n=1 Tax=Saccharophagus degradans TaxID=86304 RepID=A0AAW7X8U7_9GAMM|nr:alginate lyase family protein [Saccharophagus degradans]MDO6422996.1 alginate lyase family protein [Saccharophagus degradans]MDO6607141.1 alginate lyase family protein [Saccharophagus degradans]